MIKKNIKKRVLAVFGVLLILAITCLSVFPSFAEGCQHFHTRYVYTYDGDGTHIKSLWCDDCNQNIGAYDEVENCVINPSNSVCTFCGAYVHEHNYVDICAPYNEYQHVTDYACETCHSISATYYNYHFFENIGGRTYCTYCMYEPTSYEGHYVSSISYVNGVNFTITTNDACKGLNRDFVTDEYGDFNVTGWCYMYFGVSQYYFEIYENGILVDVIPALVNSANTLNVGQKLAVQNRASLGFHYNESWCANSAFDLTAELARYNGGTYDVVLSAFTGAGVSVQMVRFKTVTVNVTKVKETEETTEAPTEETTEDTTEEPTEETTEETTENNDIPNFNGDYNEGYQQAMKDMQYGVFDGAKVEVILEFFKDGDMSALGNSTIYSDSYDLNLQNGYLNLYEYTQFSISKYQNSVSFDVMDDIQTITLKIIFDEPIYLKYVDFFINVDSKFIENRLDSTDYDYSFNMYMYGVSNRKIFLKGEREPINFGYKSKLVPSELVEVSKFGLDTYASYVNSFEIVCDNTDFDGMNYFVCFGDENEPTLFYCDRIGSNFYNSAIEQGYNQAIEEYEKHIEDIEDKFYQIGFKDGEKKGYNDGYKDQNNFYNLIGSVFDGMTNTFFSLFAFEVMGVNVAGFILSILTILVVAFLWRKFS